MLHHYHLPLNFWILAQIGAKLPVLESGGRHAAADRLFFSVSAN
jgi:hypothetical protein